MDANWIGYMDTVMQYYLSIDPTQLSDEEWAEKYLQLQDIREKEAKPS